MWTVGPPEPAQLAGDGVGGDDDNDDAGEMPRQAGQEAKNGARMPPSYLQELRSGATFDSASASNHQARKEICVGIICSVSSDERGGGRKLLPEPLATAKPAVAKRVAEDAAVVPQEHDQRRVQQSSRPQRADDGSHARVNLCTSWGKERP